MPRRSSPMDTPRDLVPLALFSASSNPMILHQHLRNQQDLCSCLLRLNLCKCDTKCLHSTPPITRIAFLNLRHTLCTHRVMHLRSLGTINAPSTLHLSLSLPSCLNLSRNIASLRKSTSFPQMPHSQSFPRRSRARPPQHLLTWRARGQVKTSKRAQL